MVKEPKRTFSQQHTNGQQVHEEMQIKTTIRYQVTLAIMSISKTKSFHCWQEYGEKGTLVTLLLGLSTGRITMENTGNFLEINIYIQASHFWVYTQLKPKHYLEEESLNPCWLQYYSSNLYKQLNLSIDK